MSQKVLVAYASVSGSTGEVAQAIADVLVEQHQASVDVNHVRDVNTVAGYGAVVLGSSIRAGRWLPEAFQFLDTHSDAMRQMPVAYFTTCLTMVDDSADSRRTVLAYMQPVLDRVPEIEPVGLGLFAGSLDPARQRMWALKSNLTVHGDYRDWDAIQAWAEKISPVLLAETETSKVIIMRDAVLSYSDMSGSDLRGADLSGSDLHEANLSRSDLQGANLGRSDLNWATLSMANLSGADLSGANLIGANLKEADLSGTDLRQTTLNGADLSKADLRGANLRAADLNWANLSHADLSEANLSEANLGWADLSEATLDRATLTNIRYNYLTKWPEGFSAQDHGAKLISIH